MVDKSSLPKFHVIRIPTHKISYYAFFQTSFFLSKEYVQKKYQVNTQKSERLATAAAASADAAETAEKNAAKHQKAAEDAADTAKQVRERMQLNIRKRPRKQLIRRSR